MTPQRFEQITSRYSSLRIAVLGDFCLDRYLEIDPAREERSIETGLPVHNVVNVRAQPGGAGTILNNLVALGVGTIYPIGFAGFDGEGFELSNALERLAGVEMTHFVRTEQRRTFTYCKPLLCRANQPPQELNRLDSKNWTPTPGPVQERLIVGLLAAAETAAAVIVLDQVDVAETGVVTGKLLETIGRLSKDHSSLLVLADSRRGLRGYPPAVFKMNAAELSAFSAAGRELSLGEIKEAAVALARQNGRNVFVTMAEQGILGAAPDGEVEHVAAYPVRGPIDVVGAGDSVSANLTTALAAGANLREALELANAAASIVVHKLGTTGTASIGELQQCLFSSQV